MTDSAAMNRLEAAQALLGVSPNTVISPINEEMGKYSYLCEDNESSTAEITNSSLKGLEALATLATTSLRRYRSSSSVSIPISCSTSCSNSSDDDSEAMPPPPPRRRIRSCSNPEGMEKWNSLTCLHDRTRFVLPASILEEELADAKAATERKRENDNRAAKQLISQRERTKNYVPVLSQRILNDGVDPHDLLRRARSRLLEDLSEGSISGQKGELTLPHSLAKYEHVYNKNGRIGIYTPAERAVIITRFQSKRSRRVWKKKIRYNCRKNLADRRRRVKGRFVKRSEDFSPKISLTASDDNMPDVNDPEAGFSPTPDQPFRRLRRHTIT